MLRSINLPSSPYRIARHMFSSMSRGGISSGVRPASKSIAACMTQAVASAARAVDSSPRDCASMIRPPRSRNRDGAGCSTRAACARRSNCSEEERDVVLERLPASEEVRHTAAGKALGEDLSPRRVQSAESLIDPGGVRGTARSVGRTGRSASQAATARSGPRTPTCT